MEKTCNFAGYCQSKCLGSITYICKYNHYCDYQAPRDSRVIMIYEDNICNVCKQPKSRCEGHLQP